MMLEKLFHDCIQTAKDVGYYNRVFEGH